MKKLIAEITMLIELLSKQRKEAENILSQNSRLLDHEFNMLCIDISVKICAFIDEKIPALNKLHKKELFFLSNRFCLPKKVKNSRDGLNEVEAIFKREILGILETLWIKDDKYFGDIGRIKGAKVITRKKNLILGKLDKLPKNLSKSIPFIVYLRRENKTLFNSESFDIKGRVSNEINRNFNVSPTSQSLEIGRKTYYELHQPLIINRANNYNPLLIGKAAPQDPNTLYFQSFYKMVCDQKDSDTIAHPQCIKSSFDEWYNQFVMQLYFYDSDNEQLDAALLSRNNILRIQRNTRGYIHDQGKEPHVTLWNKIQILPAAGIVNVENIINVTTLAIAYEIEYSWKKIISPQLINHL